MRNLVSYFIAGAVIASNLTSQAFAADICVKSQNTGEKRLVPATYGDCTKEGPTAKEVPDVPDTGKKSKGAFRLAIFEPAQTTAWYTSCSGSGDPTIRWQGPKRSC